MQDKRQQAVKIATDNGYYVFNSISAQIAFYANVSYSRLYQMLAKHGWQWNEIKFQWERIAI